MDEQPLALKDKAVHFVGIGGCGMSGLARIVRSLGARCTGTDLTSSAVTESLQHDGIPVTLEQSAQTVPDDCDMLVISAAVGFDHPEVAEANRRGIAVLKYARMLGEMMKGRTGVAIAGTHGKSTTTAMLAHTLIECGCDPTFIVGATCEQIGGGARVGRPDLLIAEACEYDKSFHNFHPAHGVILNIEADHLDIYGSLDAVVQAFQQFAQRIAPGGSLLIGHEGAHRTTVAAGLSCRVETIGYAPQAHWIIRTAPRSGGHGQQVELLHQGKTVCEFACVMAGEHMAYNACTAAVTAHRLGATWEAIAEALSKFRGLDRRMMYLGQVRGVDVVDDYGHHPTEIDATLRALRRQFRPEQRGGRLICVFQPHQHSRTRFLLDQFATSFSDADLVIVPHIYFVRDSEIDRRAVSAADLVQKLTEGGVAAKHIDAFDDIARHLQQYCHAGDLLVVMGAGPVWQVARQFMNPA
jgi:UDP-N-acetylmuramate--alanine ligase